jgi:acyl carrier protein
MGLDFAQDKGAIAPRVIEIIAAQAMVEPEQITLDQSLNDLGLDSLGLVECIFGIEEAFDISVPFNANTPDQPGFDISSIGAIVAEVERLLTRRAA